MYNNGSLLNYARNGGTLVVQYGQYEMMRPGVMPYAISISRPHDRVTEEVAPVTILDAVSPALDRPNRSPRQTSKDGFRSAGSTCRVRSTNTFGQ